MKPLFLRLTPYLMLLMASCGSLPERLSSGPHPVADRIVFSAIQYVDVPYEFGGMSREGVDCSGLVYLAHQSAGLQVPRTSLNQYRKAKRVRKNQMRAGDLLFFKLNTKRVSHVGIYLGDGRFIHAPRTGKKVSYSHLDNRFWRTRWVSVGRYY